MATVVLSEPRFTAKAKASMLKALNKTATKHRLTHAEACAGALAVLRVTCHHALEGSDGDDAVEVTRQGLIAGIQGVIDDLQMAAKPKTETVS